MLDPQKQAQLVELDAEHLWHPFTPMKQWREKEPIVIAAAEGDELIDTKGKRYIDGVSSLWCNVHGHQVPAIDEALRDQLGKVAHSTMLGLSNVPAIEFAAKLAHRAPGMLNKVFYSDAGATATELAFKMAMGYWFNIGKPRHRFIGVSGAYHGDTAGAMSIGYSELFHKAYEKMTFEVQWTASPDVFHSDAWQEKIATRDAVNRTWSMEDEGFCNATRDDALAVLETLLEAHQGEVAAVVVEPMVQGAAGMVISPPGYLKGVEQLCRKYNTLLIADEVAVGFGRTGQLFACEIENVQPDLMALGKGISGGYLPLAATLATDEIEAAFCGEISEHKTLYHGHTYTGNPLACAAALASLELFEQQQVLESVREKAVYVAQRLSELRNGQRYPIVSDVRQQGLMVGIELAVGGKVGIGFDPSRRLGYELCDACRNEGVIIRPIGNVVILMPPLGISQASLARLLDVVLDQLQKISS